jgi:predicted metalloprotease
MSQLDAATSPALNAATAIGDDRLKQTQGHIVPESFTHGSSEQRVRWFKRGMDSAAQGLRHVPDEPL